MIDHFAVRCPFPPPSLTKCRLRANASALSFNPALPSKKTKSLRASKSFALPTAASAKRRPRFPSPSTMLVPRNSGPRQLRSKHRLPTNLPWIILLTPSPRRLEKVSVIQLPYVYPSSTRLLTNNYMPRITSRIGFSTKRSLPMNS